MKKRTLALAVLMAVSVMFTACTSSDDVKDKLGEVNNPSSTQGEADKKDDDSDKKDAKYEHGKISDSSYTSSFFGFKAEFDSSWTVLSDDDMADTNNIDDMSDENVNKVLDKSAVLYEMMASIESGSNVNIVIENLNVTNNGKSVTADEYITLSIDGLKSSLASSYEEASADKSTTSFCGKDVPCIKAEVTASGISAKEVLVPIVEGNYVAVVTFTALDDDDLNTLMGAFKAV